MNFNKHHFLNELQKAQAANVSESLNESTETLNEAQKLDLDVLLDRFQDSDYSPDNSSLKDLENFIDFIREYLGDSPRGTILEARAYNLKASEFGTDTMTQPYKTKDDINIWRVHSTYAVDQVSGENDPDARDVLFFEVMDIRDEIVVKLGGINNLKRSNGSTYGKFYSGTKEDFKKDPKKFAKEASDFLTKGDQLKWANKNVFTKSEGKKIKWAMKDDYSNVIEDLVNKSLGLKESVDEGVNEWFSIDYDKASKFVKKAWYDGLHAGRTTTGANGEKKWKQFAKDHRIDESINEGIFDIFKKKRKKEIEKKEKKNKYNPRQIYYGHPDFKKEFPGFSEDPEKEMDEAFKTLDVAEKKTIPLINEMTVDLEHIREMMTQKDMVNNDTSNAEYIVEIDKFLKELDVVDFKLRKGIW